MENQNSNKGLIALICILCVLVLALGGFIIYDKVLSKSNENTDTSNNQLNDNNCKCANSSDMTKSIDKDILGTYYLNEENDDNALYFKLKSDGTADVVESSCSEGPLPLKNVKYRITEIDNAVILEIDINEDGQYVDKYIGTKVLNRFYQTTLGCVGSENAYYEKR